MLQRLEKAYSLNLMGMTTRQIAQQLDVDHVTAARDIQRARELRREYHAASLEEKTQRRLDELDEVIRQAWLAFLATDARNLNKSGYINAIRGLLAEKSKIEGLYAPVKQELTGRNGGPIEVDLEDLQRQVFEELERVGLRLGSSDGHAAGDPGLPEADGAGSRPELSREPLPLSVLRMEPEQHAKPEPDPEPPSEPRPHVRKSVWPNQDNAPEPDQRTAPPDPRPQVQTREQVRRGTFETHDGQARYGSVSGW